MKLSIKALNKNSFALLVVILTVITYLFPAFIGKVDTPIDIRDKLMYPWRHYEVDEKIETLVLWDTDLEKSNPIIVLPASASNFINDINLDKTKLTRIINSTNSRFYLTFDFKIVSKKNNTLSLGLLLVNKFTKESFPPPSSVTALNNNWHQAYFDLNNFVNKKQPVETFNDYAVQITSKNDDTYFPTELHIKNLRLICDDYSKIQTVHNYYINDLIQLFTPIREYFSNSLKEGRLPFWNNYIFSGIEFLAEPQVGFFHPVYFLSYLLFDHFTAHSLILFLGLTLCGFGAFILMRFWGFSFSASLFTAVVYMFHPFNAKWLSYEHVLTNSAVIPFLFLAYEKNLKENKFLNKYLLLSTLILGLIFISGHLQKVYYSLVFFGFFFLFKLFQDRINFLKQVKSFLFIFLIGLMIGAIVLIPFFPVLLNSHREPLSDDFVKATSIPFKALLGILYPFYKGIPHSIGSESMDPAYRAGFFRNYLYFGFLPCLFLLFSIKTLLKNKLTLFFLFSLIVSLLVSMGTPLFYLFKIILPGFKQMQHFRFIEIYSYSVPFLAGIGLETFLNLLKPHREKIKHLIIFSIIIISLIDLMYFSSYFITWSPRASYKPLQKLGSLEFLIKQKNNSKKPFRVLPFAVGSVGETKLNVNIAQPNTLEPYGIEDVSGYSSFVPKDIYNLFVYIQTKDRNKLYTKELSQLFNNPNIPYPIFNFKSKILDLLNVKYFMVPKILTLEDKNIRQVYEGDCAIYENLDYFPRAFLVPDYKVIESNIDTIVGLDSEEFDPRKEVILMTSVIARSDEVTTKQSPNATRNEIASSALSEPPRNDIEFITYQPENITLKVNTDESSFLVLGHNLNNHWKVKVNGREGRHVQANLVQRAVYLPQKGEYLIEFYYFPKSFLIGALITLSGLIVLMLLALFLKFKR